MPRAAPIVMNMNFVVVPLSTDLEGSTPQAIFVVILCSTWHRARLKPNFFVSPSTTWELASFPIIHAKLNN